MDCLPLKTLHNNNPPLLRLFHKTICRKMCYQKLHNLCIRMLQFYRFDLPLKLFEPINTAQLQPCFTDNENISAVLLAFGKQIS